MIHEIDIKRFNALASHSRSPFAAYISKELAWFSNNDGTIIGILLLDLTDNDYTAIIMAKDESKVFRCFDLQCSFPTSASAKAWLFCKMEENTLQGLTTFPQGGPKTGVDLFTPVTSTEKQHPYFISLSNNDFFMPARAIINCIMPSFIDIDGNFVEQFQTTGFDARLWELYINTYLVEEQLFIERTSKAPDFIVQKYGKDVAIEAVIVGRKKEQARSVEDLPSVPNRSEITELLLNEMPIRWGSSLYTKLRKEYWTLSHVAEKPLVFAIADFHDDQSMLWSSSALIIYLYGLYHTFAYDENNKLIINTINIDKHKVPTGKEISSGFFFQPNVENVSAVLSSTSGTISKFNRMGRQAGFYLEGMRMIRTGVRHDHDPNASVPKPFEYIVDETCNETWAEGLSMFHNPNALHPVPKELFPNIAHHELLDGRLVSYLPEFHPYASVTLNILGRDRDH